MIRIEQQGEEVESEERKKVREAVLGNVATFVLLIGLIRAVPYVMQQLKN